MKTIRFNQKVKAVHRGDGNYFDNMLVDISESHQRFVHLTRKPKSIKRSIFRNTIKLYLTRIALRIGIYEFLTMNGIKKKWLDEFREYWSCILNGRPFWNTFDFFSLLHDYRKRQQYTSQLEWNDPERHILNWQGPNQIYSTMHSVRVIASKPIVSLPFLKRLRKGAFILEYGCSLAPYYYSYREFFSHLDCNWVLADIPNFPFHYAKYLYRNDLKVDFVTINAKDFLNPLGEMGGFDVIILTTVLEHLDNPLYISEYLLQRLKPNGLFCFDYIKSEGTGLDHPNALEQREDCLKSILERTQIIHGKIDDINESVGLCIARKKPVHQSVTPDR
jgi:2-polyprenyl-3-methyl-5-hydroxy-6-metoxy-1,4-benzoquinol methylase